MNTVAEQIDDHYSIRVIPFRQPHSDLLMRQLNEGVSVWRVPCDRNPDLREPLYTIARYLQREIGYDLAPYSKDHISTRDCGFLFSIEPDVDTHFGLGAAYFTWNEWRDSPPSYCLEWVWLHPFFRRRRHLEQVWPDFRRDYGDFVVRPPWSSAMEAFLGKVGYEHPSPR